MQGTYALILLKVEYTYQNRKGYYLLKKTMKQLNRSMLSQMIQEKIDALNKIQELKRKTNLIESEIQKLVGEEFDAEEFFSAAGFAAQDDIEKEFGKDEWTPLGSSEDTNDFVSDLMNASDEEAEKLSPDYFAENIIFEDEDGMTYSQ